MSTSKRLLLVGAAIALGFAFGPAKAQPVDTARIAAGNPNDWLTYHGSYNDWNYSGLDQINTNNVKDLSIAWIHVPGKSTRGLQSVPLVRDVHRRSLRFAGTGRRRPAGRTLYIVP